MSGNADTQSKMASPWPRYLSAELGLRNYWYAGFFTDELAEGAVRAEQICGERILFKRIDGRIYGIEDRCAHRGVAFSDRPTCHSKNTVTCWVHGFTYDVRNGKLVQIITDPDSTLIGKVSIRNYAVEEVGNVAFVWIGDQEPLPIMDELPRSFLPHLNGGYPTPPRPASRIKMLGNWRMALENVVDLTHFYGHRTQEHVTAGHFPAPLSQLPPAIPSTIEIDQPGLPQSLTVMSKGMKWYFEVPVEDQMVTSPASQEQFKKRWGTASSTFSKQFENVEGDALVTAYLPAALEVGGPDGTSGLVEFYTPIDEDHHMLIVVHTSSLELPERIVSNDVEKYGDVDAEGFLNFDAFYRAKMHHAYKNEDWFRRSRAYQGDSTVMALRRFVENHARGIQLRDGNWARQEEHREMEPIYPAPAPDTAGPSA